MKLKYLHACAIILWGIQADMLLYAMPMAIILEGQYHLNRRWALTKQDFYRTSDLTSLALIVLIIFLFLNRREYHFITTLIAWLPIVFFPLVVVLAYSTTERMSLDVLFYSLRRQKQPVTQSWDMGYVFFGLCLVAAGTNVDGARFYSPFASLLVLIALYRLRSPRYAARIWLLSACVLFLSATFLHQGLRESHLALKEKTRAWLSAYIRDRINPLKTHSTIGTLGELKLSDAIRFRIEPLGEDRLPALFQEASYDIPSENDWMVISPQFTEVPHVDDFVWRLGPTAPTERRARVYLEFERENDIVPVPISASEIVDLPATDLRISRFGAVQALGLVRSPGYEVRYVPGTDLNGTPDEGDTYVPGDLTPLLDGVLAPFVDEHLTPLETVTRVFRDFRYSLVPTLSAEEKPLTWFLTRSHAGHCEYFASATVLLLRRMGIPARYIVGFSVQEYSTQLEMYVVRERHAHAWASAYIDGQWQVVDTTPAIWAESEAARASILQPMWDFVANAAFLFQRWWNNQKIEDYELELYIVGALLALFLVFRIATSEQVVINREEEPAISDDDTPGMHSPFFRIESLLSASGRHRAPGETFSRWVDRVGHAELLPLLTVHNQLRFDPDGIDAAGLVQLTQQVDSWITTYSVGSE